MADVDDIALLREYANSHSDPAFAEIVHRHINLVYSVALRFTGNCEDARDVTQAVFVILAKKAASLRPKTVLTGWLYETTRFTAMNFLTSKARRQAREQEACMQSILNNSNAEENWRYLAPMLEDAMTRLSRKERTLIALRFFESKTFAETAALLGIEEWAARKRASRAVDKLQKFFFKRGVNSTASVIADTISAHSIQAAPEMLAKSVTTVALAKGATASASTLTLIKGALKLMAWTQMKTAVVVGAGLLVVAGTATVTVNEMRQRSLEDGINWTPNQSTLDRQPPVALLRLTMNAMTGNNGKLIPLGGASMCMVTPSGRMLALNTDLGFLLRFAYDNARVDRQLLWGEEEPTNRFDAIYTLPSGRQGQLQQLIRKQTGWTAGLEDKVETVLALKVINANAPGLKPSAQARGSATMGGPRGGESYQGVSMAIVARTLSREMQVPVVDQTGVTGRFDFQLNQDFPTKSLEEKKQIVLDQLGLDLVPTEKKQAIKVLVAQKVK